MRLEPRRAANPTVPFRRLGLPLQPRAPTFKRVTARRLEGGRRSSRGAPRGPRGLPGPPGSRSGLRGRGARLPKARALVLVTKENFALGFPACKQLSDFLLTLESQQPAFQSKVSWLMSLTLAQPIRRAFRKPALRTLVNAGSCSETGHIPVFCVPGSKSETCMGGQG